MICILIDPKDPLDKLRVIRIQKKLGIIEKLVGGKLEIMRYEKVLLVYNIEQQKENLNPNKVFNDMNLNGTVLIVGNNENVGDMRSLNKKELKYYINKIKNKDISKEQENEK